LSRGSGRRIALRHELTLEVDIETKHKFHTGVTQDVSAGGLFVATREPRPSLSKCPRATKSAVKAFCVDQETAAYQALCAVLNLDA